MITCLYINTPCDHRYLHGRYLGLILFAHLIAFIGKFFSSPVTHCGPQSMRPQATCLRPWYGDIGTLLYLYAVVVCLNPTSSWCFKLIYNFIKVICILVSSFLSSLVWFLPCDAMRLSYRNSVRLSVCPSVCHTRALCPHGSTYDHDFFTIW